MTAPAALADALAALEPRIDGELRRDLASRVLYSTDASIYQVMPHAVLIPRSVGDVQAALEVAAEHGVPLLPRAAGSSLAGQAVNEALVIDFTRHLDRVLEVRPEERRVTVEPGVVLDELNRVLGAYGLQFGPDPASSDRAALGGIVANNSTGAHSILYGMTADHVEEMGVLLSDGTAVRFVPLDPGEAAARGGRPGREGAIYRELAALAGDDGCRRAIRQATPRHWRRCGGYNLDRLVEGAAAYRWPPDPRFNLARLVCGSEGTLAVITDVTLNLVPVPRRTALAVVHFASLYRALAAVPEILEVGPSAIELLDRLGLTLCREVPAYARLVERFIDGQPDCVLITEFQGGSDAETAAAIDRLERRLAAAGAGAGSVVRALEPERQRDIWTVRKAGLGLLMSLKGDHKPIPFIEDAAVPVEHLADYVSEIERFCGELGTRVAYYAHASAGCIHIRPLIDAKQAAEVAKLPEILSFSVELLRGYGGALSSEHGDGRARSWINERFFGPEMYGLFRRVKRAFDPANLLNPGNVVDAGPMTDNLRFGADYRVRLPPERIDFAPDLGLDRAVEMCNGAGVCRKRTAATMCPSFMVTREEEHSTRGRANLLRAALDGRLGGEAITGRRLYDALDLCVECKACKAECPSSVDMAKLKLQFLAGYHAVHGVPLRARLFAGAGRLGRLAAGPAAPLANALGRSRPLRGAFERLVGITARRPLPEFARLPYPAWLRRHRRAGPPATGRVVLLVDCFNGWQTPRVARAATEVLEAAGFELVASKHGCCGRPMISKGLVDEARAAARATVDRLAPLAESGLPIVGIEPSCLLTLRDEYAYLLPGDPRVAVLAGAAHTFEEFVGRREVGGGLELRSAEERLLVHDHCHQKALVGSGPTAGLLGLLPGRRIELLDAGCCGMAGSFGYEAEHYELSMAMAERRLLPAVRAAGESAAVVANGTSCRQQIAHGCGRRALHPAEIVRSALVAPPSESASGAAG